MDESNDKKTTKKSFEEINLDNDMTSLTEQVAQLCNMADNFSVDPKYISDLILRLNRVYSDETTEAFKQSIHNSLENFFLPQRQSNLIKDLKKNETDSFLLVPYASKTHKGLGVVFNIDDNICLWVVNKMIGNTKPLARYKYIECVISKDKADALKKINDNSVSSLALYGHLLGIGKTQALQIDSRSQKFNGCWCKGAESTYKFILAVHKMSVEELKRLRNSEKYFKAKWPNETYVTHHKYIKDVILHNPKANEVLSDIYRVYYQNKVFREYIQDGLDFRSALTKAFADKDECVIGNDDRRILALLENINLDTYMQCKFEIKNFFKTIKRSQPQIFVANYKQTYVQFKLLNDLVECKYFNSNKRNIEKVKSFPIVTSQLKQTYAKIQLDKALECKKNRAIRLIDISLKLKPEYPEALYHKALIYYKKRDYPNAISSLNKAITIKPREENNYLLRSQVHYACGNIDKAFEDLDTIENINPYNHNVYLLRGLFLKDRGGESKHHL